jgi:hypothetical protein
VSNLLLSLAAVVLVFHFAPVEPACARPALGEGPAGSVDEELVRMGREIPGFGGLFYDAGGYPTVYLLNPQDRIAISSVKSLGKEVRVRRGDFEFERLVEWRHAVRPALALPGVVFLDADEARNRVVIGLDSTSPQKSLNRERLERELLATSVPRQAVLVVDVTPTEPLTTGLQSKLRPVPAGVQIAFSNFACTLGFNAYLGHAFGFVINSHCTDSRGEVDGTRYFQSLPSGGTIGTEIADPGFFTEPPCPVGKRCRYSDSAFAKYDNPHFGALAKIARPTSGDPGLGSLTLSPASARFAITGRFGSPLTGEVVHKVGRTTGWTYGTVVATCVDRGIAGTDIFMFCQSEVQAGVGPGDSGSPVFSRSGGGNKAKLVGILWGGRTDPDLGSIYVFSPLENIEQELGPLKIN